MKLFAATISVLLAGAFVVQAQTSSADYALLTEKAGTADPDIDYTALRRAYTMSAQYDPYGFQLGSGFEDAWKAFSAKDCKAALEKTDAVLKIDFTISTVHFMRSDCLKQSGDEAQSLREGRIAKGLLSSVISSGDGKSIATAYVIATMREEQQLLVYNQAAEVAQSLLRSGDKMIDKISAKNRKTGETSTLYFDVTAPFRGQMRAFENQSGTPPKP